MREGPRLHLSACIVTYNDQAEALRAAASVLAHTRRHPLTLYLVDNASPDGTGAALEQAVAAGALAPGPGQAVRVIRREKNAGFGAGHNTVLPQLASDYHFILNPDILLEGDTLSDLAEWLEGRPAAVMARPALRFPDGREQQLPLRRCSLRAMVYRQLSFLTFLKKYNDAYIMAGEDLTVPRPIEFCTGSFMAARTADLTQKMLRRGEVWLVPQYTAVHVWHRAAHRSLGPMLWQARSLCRYFGKWGFRL